MLNAIGTNLRLRNFCEAQQSVNAVSCCSASLEQLLFDIISN